MSETSSPDTVIKYAPLHRRLLAMLYDGFLLVGILIIAVGIAFIVNGGAIGRDHPYHELYMAYLLTVIFIYYGWFWTHGGQTLGMKTWRIRLYKESGIGWKEAALYFTAAMLSWGLLAAGYLVSLVHPQKRTLHDLIAGTVMRDLRD